MDAAPAAIGCFMDAAAQRDYDALAACFTEDATVSDEGQTHRGRSQIRRWQKDTRAKWIYTVTIVGGEPRARTNIWWPSTSRATSRAAEPTSTTDSQCAPVSSAALRSCRDGVRAPPPRRGVRARCRPP